MNGQNLKTILAVNCGEKVKKVRKKWEKERKRQEIKSKGKNNGLRSDIKR